MSVQDLEAEAIAMTNRHTFQRLAALPFFVLALSAVAASAAPQPPTPGAAQQTAQPQRAMPIDQSVQLPALTGNAARPAAIAPGGPQFTVNSIAFSGNTKVTTEALRARAAKSLGRAMTLADLYAVAQDLTRFYQSQGYPLASVNVPEQRVDSGSVSMVVTEGRVGKVRVEGQRYYTSAALEAQLSELAGGEVITTALLERELLLLNDLPGITAQVVVLPGAEPGTSDLVIKVAEDSVSFYAGADNHGRDSLGENRFSFNVNLNGLGRGDYLALNLTHSDGNLLNYGRIAYSTPLGTDGMRFTGSYLLTDYEVGGAVFNPLDPAGRSYTARGEISYPVVRSRNSNRIFTVAYSGTKSESEAKALGTILSQSEIQLIELAYYGNDVYGDRHTLSWSVGFSGNGEFNEGAMDNEQCCKLFGDIALTLPVGDTWYSKTKLRGAWAPDAVADVERFSLGGPYSVRGYEASELRGDTGFDASVELHRPFSLFGGRGDLLFFADAGQVVTNTATGAEQSSMLGSVGAGFTAFDVYGFECNLQWAIAVGGYDPEDGERDGRAYFSVGRRF